MRKQTHTAMVINQEQVSTDHARHCEQVGLLLRRTLVEAADALAAQAGARGLTTLTISHSVAYPPLAPQVGASGPVVATAIGQAVWVQVSVFVAAVAA